MIPKNQRRHAAKFFTISALGNDEPKTLEEIDREFDELNHELVTETGIGIDDEFQVWLLDVDVGDAYCVDEWNDRIYPKLLKESSRRRKS